MSFQKDKFKNLILYFAKKSEKDENFGSVKLNKLLLRADLMAYGYNGSSITGARYIHLNQGPGPSEFAPVFGEMENFGEAKTEVVNRFGSRQKRTIALKDADMSKFEPHEQDIADEALAALRSMNSFDVSDQTHNWTGWIYTDEKEHIPNFTVFVQNPPRISLADLNWGDNALRSSYNREEGKPS